MSHCGNDDPDASRTPLYVSPVRHAGRVVYLGVRRT
jgi:hypothetical protein